MPPAESTWRIAHQLRSVTIPLSLCQQPLIYFKLFIIYFEEKVVQNNEAQFVNGRGTGGMFPCQ